MPEVRNVPQIRFKGFTEPWEQRKVFDLFEIVDDRGYPELPILSATQDQGMVSRDGSGRYVGHDKANEQGYKKVSPGDFVIHLRSFQGGFAHSPITGITSPAYTIFAAQEPNQHSDRFWKHWFMSKRFIDSLTTVTYGIRDGRSISVEEFFDTILLFPTKAEQDAIASTLDQLDRLITLHQRKLDKLTSVKKSLLEKMFPKPGSDVPEIRFAEFTDPWEQRKLGEVGKARSGIGFPDAEQGGTSGTPFFKVSDMNNVGNENELNVANNYVTDVQIAARRWSPIEEVPAIFFAKVGAAVMLNRKRLCRFPFLLDNNTMAYSLGKDQWDADFAKAFFETVDLTSLVQVGALPSYNAGDVEAMEVMLPEVSEQRQIGTYFCNLDHLITLHQRKLDMLGNIKKSLLDKMFV
ncbi:restriction endonuclease subunit S [Trueperella pyogenes]|uniref:restriction endonuclease subunit S n=1 Tax=Trueperella pyogenes TaxID=1661 RepID=UPI00345CD973